MGPEVSRIACALAASLALALAMAPGASATTYTVGPYLYPEGSVYDDGHTCDPLGAGIECTTIRAAVQASDAAGGSNTIQLSFGTVQLTIPPSGTDDVTTGDLNITTGTTVVGAGASASVINANGIDRVFNVADGVSLTLNGVGLRNGHTSTASRPDESGGAIEAQGGATVTLVNSRIFNGTAADNGNGGAIAIGTGALSLKGSWLESNQAGGSGGAMFASNAAALNVDSSTMDMNTATLDGGAVSATTDAPPAIVNSTILNNTAGHDGGAVDASVGSGVMTVDNATIVHNTASGGSGGNLRVTGAGSVSIQNSIVGGGTAAGSPNNCSFSALATDAGNNLFFDLAYSAVSSDNCFGTPSSTDISAGSASLANGPGLANSGGNFTIASSGGPAPTLALIAGSPALNNANVLGCAGPFPQANGADERGTARLPGGLTRCDIGAFEPEAPVALTGSVDPTTGAVGQPLTYTFNLTNTGSDTATNVRLNGTLPGGSVSSLSLGCGFLLGLSCNLGSLLSNASSGATIVVTPPSPGTYSMTATGADDQSGATQPVTLTAVVPGTPAASGAAPGASPPPTPPAQAAKGAKGTANKCGSLRSIRIHVQNVKKFGVVSARIYYLGKLRATVGSPHFAATVNLRQRQRGTVKIRIVARLKSGKTISATRVYHPCVQKKLRGRTHFKL